MATATEQGELTVGKDRHFIGGDMGNKTIVQRVFHKLFRCPSFWSIKPAFQCPECGKKYRCYWDGNDIIGRGTDICNACANGYTEKENPTKAVGPLIGE